MQTAPRSSGLLAWPPCAAQAQLASRPRQRARPKRSKTATSMLSTTAESFLLSSRARVPEADGLFERHVARMTAIPTSCRGEVAKEEGSCRHPLVPLRSLLSCSTSGLPSSRCPDADPDASDRSFRSGPKPNPEPSPEQPQGHLRGRLVRGHGRGGVVVGLAGLQRATHSDGRPLRSWRQSCRRGYQPQHPQPLDSLSNAKRRGWGHDRYPCPHRRSADARSIGRWSSRALASPGCPVAGPGRRT